MSLDSCSPGCYSLIFPIATLDGPHVPHCELPPEQIGASRSLSGRDRGEDHHCYENGKDCSSALGQPPDPVVVPVRVHYRWPENASYYLGN